MSKRRVRNVAASNRARLLNLSYEKSESFQHLLERWVVERFLYRLSHSPHHHRFVLKGAMLFLAWTGSLYRPTRDLDLLGSGDSSSDTVIQTMSDVCTVEVDDGLVFDLSTLAVEKIREDARYDGIRVRIRVLLDAARVNLQIDVGFGDAVEPQLIQFPTLFGDDSPTIKAYPPVTAIAEKLEAMVVLGIANSRMKDFFDTWALAETQEFRLSELRGAVSATFAARRTMLPSDLPLALTPAFYDHPAKVSLWQVFVKRSRSPVALTPPRSFAEVGTTLAKFLGPTMTSSGTLEKVWPPGGAWKEG